MMYNNYLAQAGPPLIVAELFGVCDIGHELEAQV